MVTDLRARPTTYNGIRMRSRLEARVAAALDAFGITWEYEPRAFGNASGQYLPDFALPGRGPVYLEVRPSYVAEQHERMRIIWSSEPDAVLFLGSERELEAGVIAGWYPGDPTSTSRSWVRCPCGRFAVCPARPRGPSAYMTYMLCRGCGDECWRDPSRSPRVFRLPPWQDGAEGAA